MAQEQGFEPWHRVTDLRAFQARPFNHLGIPAMVSDVGYFRRLNILPQIRQMGRTNSVPGPRLSFGSV